jgi:hypothetical protein
MSTQNVHEMTYAILASDNDVRKVVNLWWPGQLWELMLEQHRYSRALLVIRAVTVLGDSVRSRKLQTRLDEELRVTFGDLSKLIRSDAEWEDLKKTLI